MDQIIKTTVSLMMVAPSGKTAEHPRMQIRIPPGIAKLLGEYIVPSGNAKTGLVLDHATPDTHDRLHLKNLDNPHLDARVDLHARFTGVEDLSLLYVSAAQRVEAKLIQATNGARLVVNPFNPLMQQHRTPVARHRNVNSKYGPKDNAMPLPVAAAPVDTDKEMLKKQISLIREMGNATLFNAVVTLHRLANKLHVRLRADDEKGIIAFQETEM